ncbi:MAG: hypothetical protein KGM97_04375 [Alphaproteobacteria bacterium]|nr:hypothetical protein [Alphaproteobacteria bacterium]MDE2630210.1 hypothetical protein [Alphaproteobacteria bacterium]
MRSTWQKASVAVTICAAITAAFGLNLAFRAQAATPEPTSFQKQVLPIFEAHCFMCHSQGGVGYVSVNLDLRSYRALRSGSAGGVAVIPYHPERSPLMKVLRDDWTSNNKNALRMPPLGPPLSQEELDVISRWIKEGAKDN